MIIEKDIHACFSSQTSTTRKRLGYEDRPTEMRVGDDGAHERDLKQRRGEVHVFVVGVLAYYIPV